MGDFYVSQVDGFQLLADPQKWNFTSPVALEWDRIKLPFLPILGQPLRIRESISLEFTRKSFTDDNTIWLNRPRTEAFIGHYQVQEFSGSSIGNDFIITDRGQMIGAKALSDKFVWSYYRDYDLDFVLSVDDQYAALPTAIKNCNADLRPGAVPNTFIDATNVSTYVEIAYGIATGDLVNAAALIDSLTAPTTAGYRFGDDILFQAQTNLPTIDLKKKVLTLRLLSLSVWIHPDWEIRQDGRHSVQFLNYNIIDKATNQFPKDATCDYPGSVSFPP